MELTEKELRALFDTTTSCKGLGDWRPMNRWATIRFATIRKNLARDRGGEEGQREGGGEN